MVKLWKSSCVALRQVLIDKLVQFVEDLCVCESRSHTWCSRRSRCCPCFLWWFSLKQRPGTPCHMAPAWRGLLSELKQGGMREHNRGQRRKLNKSTKEERSRGGKKKKKTAEKRGERTMEWKCVEMFQNTHMWVKLCKQKVNKINCTQHFNTPHPYKSQRL